MELPVTTPPVAEPQPGASASTTSGSQSAKNPTSAGKWDFFIGLFRTYVYALRLSQSSRFLGSSRKIGRIHDFSSNSSAPKNDDDDEDDGEDDKQAFYAGGGAHGGSGQQVLGPAGKKKDPNKMIEELFKVMKDSRYADCWKKISPMSLRVFMAFVPCSYRLPRMPARKK